MFAEPVGEKPAQEMIEALLGKDDVILICHRKKADLINSFLKKIFSFIKKNGNLIFST